MAEPLLDVQDLQVTFATEDGLVRAVDGVSFTLDRGEVVAIVGESGSGKSVTVMTLMGLTRSPNARFAGSARLRGGDLVTASEEELERVRGRDIAMIFQDPIASLSPVQRIGNQIAEQIRAHEKISKAEALDRAAGLMGRGGIARGREGLGRVRGRDIAMIFQAPTASPSPVQRIGNQIAEQIRAHEKISKAEALDRAAGLMERVGIPRARDRLRAYPHEFSGGMRQRVM